MPQQDTVLYWITVHGAEPDQWPYFPRAMSFAFLKHVCCNYALYMMQTNQPPLYMEDVFDSAVQR